VSQETRVLKVGPAQAAALETRLRGGLPPEAEWRPVPHARFSVKALGTVVTCYTSGKLVVQGRDLDTFAARFFDDFTPVAGKAQVDGGDPDLPFDVVTIGSDEAGKGDYFGPLVVAAVRAGPDDAAWLAEIGVADSKVLADDKARRLAGQIEARLDHQIVRLDPPAYNARHAAVRNVNIVLGALHAEAIAALLGRHADVRLALVDRFGDERHVADPLRARVPVLPRIVQVPRAERHPAVAAASVLARAAFLDGLQDCSEACGTDLHKGAGEPTDVAARRVFAIGGRALLETVAKMHFKNTLRAER
jgi:ribonuclease HIII